MSASREDLEHAIEALTEAIYEVAYDLRVRDWHDSPPGRAHPGAGRRVEPHPAR
ncbi:MAG: hypothetical protein M3067_05760 [Chloroflexota bacterium]|nr:hypothetical protein [Chloroflexota bacterium]